MGVSLPLAAIWASRWEGSRAGPEHHRERLSHSLCISHSQGDRKGQDLAQPLCDQGSTSYQSQGTGSQEDTVCRGQNVAIWVGVCPGG